jgi:hypothetical protein
MAVSLFAVNNFDDITIKQVLLFEAGLHGYTVQASVSAVQD